MPVALPSPDADASKSRPLRIFISYASEDVDRIKPIYDALSDAGAEYIFWDRPEIDPGEQWKRELYEGVRTTHLMLAMLTPQSVDKDSFWIGWEQAEAARLFRPIIPVMLEKTPVPAHLKDTQYVDLTDGDDYRDLINAIGKWCLRHADGQEEMFWYGREVSDMRFVGREKELSEVFELLEDDVYHIDTQRQPVAIQGMGGTGKTMLAEELWRRLSGRHPGGSAVVQQGAQDAAPPRTVLKDWAQTLAGHDRPLGKEWERDWKPIRIRRELQRKYGQLLVLIDDVGEKEFEAANALIGAMAQDASILLTTRSTVIENTVRCRLYRLGDLEEADGIALLRDRLANKAGKQPAESVLRRLYGLVSGHALSLDLAVGRCDGAGDLPRQVDRLDRALSEGKVDRLAVEAVGAEGKKNLSVAANLSHSFEALVEFDASRGSDLTRRFRALGVFPDHGKIDAGMLAAVWGDESEDDAADEASRLIKRAMLKYDEHMDDPVVVLHPVLRAYALGLLRKEPDELDAARRRYAAHLIPHVREIFGSRRQDWSRVEHYGPHVLRLARHLVDALPRGHGGDAVASFSRPSIDGELPRDLDFRALSDARTVLEFSDAVRQFILRRPETGKRGKRCLELGLAAARLLAEQEAEVVYLDALGRWFERSEPALAGLFYDAALERLEGVSAPKLQARVYTHKGELLRTRDKPHEAIELLEGALEVHRKRDNKRMQASALKSLGETHWRIGDHDKAWELHSQALAICREIENRSLEGDMLNKLGSVEFNRGNKEEAIKLFNEALVIHREVRNRSMEGEDLNDMGVSYTYLDQLDRALHRLISAALIHHELGNRRLEAIAMCNLAHTYIRLELYEPARLIADDALTITEELEDTLVPESWALCWKGRALQALGRLDDALPLLQEALEKSRKAENKRGEAGHLGHLAALHRDLGEHDEAIGHLQQAIALMQEHELDEAFGGRRQDDFRAALDEIERQR